MNSGLILIVEIEGVIAELLARLRNRLEHPVEDELAGLLGLARRSA